MAGVRIELKGYDELLKALDRIDDTLSTKLGRDMVKNAGAIVAAKAKSLVRTGDPRHNPDAKPLEETINVEIKDYGTRTLAVVGPAYPAGAHGHLLEFGHDIVPRGAGKVSGGGRGAGVKQRGGVTRGRTRPFPFLRPAFDSTKGEQMRAMESVMNEAIRALNGG